MSTNAPTRTATTTATPAASQPDAAPAIQLQGVSYTYPGAAAPALDDVTLRVEHGSRLGILGPNGGGKTTLLRLALGLLRPQAGAITIYGRSPQLARRDSLIGYVPQRAEIEPGFPLSARQVVALGAAQATPPWRSLSKEQQAAIDEALRVVAAEDLADRPIGKLSGGQAQRILIARALAARPRLLLLDEPTVGIDIAGQRRFAELLDRIHTSHNLTLVIVSHSVRTIASGCDRVACLRARLHSHTAPAGLTPQLLAELFSHDAEGLFGGVDVVVATPRGDQGHAHVHGEGCGHDHTEPGT